MKYIFMAFIILISCGKPKSEDDAACVEKTEIDTLAISSATYGSLGSDIDITATLKGQCSGKTYQGIYVLKEGSQPSDCTDGDSKIAGSTTFWNGKKASTLYYIRACATTSGYTSTGVVKSVTTPDP